MKKIAILGGLGMEGQALSEYLKKHDPKTDITILDQKLDPNYLSNLNQFDLVYRSPGVLYNLPEIQKAIRGGVKFSSPTNLFFEKAKGKIIGITGTKGKGTTTQLVYEVLKNAGLEVYSGGNIGKAATDLIDQLTDNSITVLELSSVQLWDIKYSPHIAGVLGIFPDHIDWHKSFRGYRHAKYNIAKFQTKNDAVFYFPDNKYSRQAASKSRGKRIAVDPDSLKISLKVPGEHNRRNAAMAAAICAHLKVKPEIILETVRTYGGLPHRLQLIATTNGVDIYNDSASTNPQTTIAAIQTFNHKMKVLILGGREKKGLNYGDLTNLIKNDKNIRAVVLFDEDKQLFKQRLGGRVNLKVASSLKQAVDIALKETRGGDVLLFSPGATSFASFNNYQERGDAFAGFVKDAI